MLHCCRYLFCLLLALCAGQAMALESVTLQLKWRHAFQFAGYYAAVEQGYYREAGLDVRLLEAMPGVDVISQVMSGKAEFGVGTSSLLLARKAGQPVVALAVIFQHSPLVLIARQQSATQGIQDLHGKRLMLEEQSEELLAYLKQEGVALDGLKRLRHSFDLRDLIDGKVDAMSAYVTNEPYFLARAHQSFQTYTPRSAGIDFYGDNLFTSEYELTTHHERVKAFREASLRGWQYAMAHPQEIAELIHRRYSTYYSRDFYLFEARQMAPLIRADLIEIGYMNEGRWRHIADTYADLGMLPRNFPLADFIYNAHQPADYRWLYWWLGLSLLVASGVAVLAWYIHRINRRLDEALTLSRQAEQELRSSEERHRLLADHASDVIWTMDLQGRFTYISPSVEKLRGYSVAEAMQQSLEEAFTKPSAMLARAGLGGILEAIQTGGAMVEFRSELAQLCKDGSPVWTEVTCNGMRNAAGQFVGILGVSRDISERKRSEARILHMAQHDMLTGLPNRALFSDRLQQALGLARREQKRLALLFLDLDHLKPINDNYGHNVGDLLLRQVAQRIGQAVRASDTVARIGGDEFVVLLPVIHDDGDAAQVAEKIRLALEQPFELAGLCLQISSSIGVATFPEHGSDEVELLKYADSAMYAAKQTGRNRVCGLPGACAPLP